MYSTWSEDELDYIICHELFHLITARIDDTIERYIGPGEVYRAYGRVDEAAADSFAGIMIQAYRKRS